MRGLFHVFAFASLILMAGGARAADLGVAKQFFPPDSSATIEQPQGKPPAAVVRAADGRILGYAFSTYDVSGSVGYAGRPLDIVAAVTPEGIIAGAQIVAHEEPILVIGIPRDALAAYVAAFKGFDVRAGAALKQTKDLASGPHAVAGATITSTVIRDAIVRSARVIWRSREAVADSVVARPKPCGGLPGIPSSPRERCNGCWSPAVKRLSCSAPRIMNRRKPLSISGLRSPRRRRSGKACWGSESMRANWQRSVPMTISS